MMVLKYINFVTPYSKPWVLREAVALAEVGLETRQMFTTKVDTTNNEIS